jgi:integrase
MFGLTSVELPHFKRVDKLPFIPLESEIDMVIAGVRIKMATMLQLLKETAFRPIEAWRLQWTT